MSEYKDIDTRVRELVQIRQQLTQLGVLIDPDLVLKVRNMSNMYLKHRDCSTTFRYKIPHTQSRVVIQINAQVGRESGVTLEM